MICKLKNFIKILTEILYIIMILIIITFFFKLLYDVYDISRNINFFEALW